MKGHLSCSAKQETIQDQTGMNPRARIVQNQQGPYLPLPAAWMEVFVETIESVK